MRTDKERKEFGEVTKPVIKWLDENCHPHVMVVIDPTSAVLCECEMSVITKEFLRD